MKEKIRIIFLAANPLDTKQLDLEEEAHEIERKLEAAQYRDDFELISKWAARPEDIQHNLLKYKPHIVHFSGHGSSGGEIVLRGPDGKAKSVDKKALAGLFKTLKDNIKVVVLNACYSKEQAEGITEVIDCAVGTQKAISDEAATAFASSFYEGLAFGRSVKEAFELGVSRLELEGIVEETTPVLCVREGVVTTYLIGEKQKPGDVDVEVLKEKSITGRKETLIKSKLPAELVSLIHHVELNKTDWWEKFAKQLLLATIYLSGENIGPSVIAEKAKKIFSVTIDPQRLKTLLNELCSTKVLIQLPGNKYKISEQPKNEFLEGLKAADATEKCVRDKFVKIIRKYCPNINADECWTNFNENFLLPYIMEAGARTYEFISGKTAVLDKAGGFYTFLQYYEPETSKSIRKAIISFLDPEDIDVRSYITKYLNVYFFVEACNLSEKTLKALYSVTNEKFSINIFVDTNFLFSFLEMNEDFFNEAAKSLIDLLQKVPNRLSVKLWVSSITLAEAKQVLEREIERFKHVQIISPKLAEISLDAETDGFFKHIARETLKVGHRINASEHFKKYSQNLSTMLKSKNFNFSMEKLEKYKDDKRIQAEINNEIRYESQKYGEKGKTRYPVVHDVILWHFVNDKRPEIIENPIEAGYWILTVDHRFINYDIRKQSYMKVEIPLCTFPTSIIQMLQFWMPRNQYFEEKLFKSFLASFFQKFNPQSEKITARILEALTYYESIDSLSNDDIKSILLNEALRGKIALKKDEGKEIELVGETIIGEYKTVKEEYETVKKEYEGVKEEYETIKKEKTAQEKKWAQVKLVVVIQSIVICIVLISFFEFFVYKLPFTWLIKHEYSYTLQAAIDFTILFFFLGLYFKRLRK